MPESPTVMQFCIDRCVSDWRLEAMEVSPLSKSGVLLQPSRTRCSRFLRRLSGSNEVPTRLRQP